MPMPGQPGLDSLAPLIRLLACSVGFSVSKPDVPNHC